jgi:predicted ATPase
VTGPGGSGKTRFAIAVAGRLQELFGPAIAFLSLVDLTDAERIPGALAEALALIQSPEIDPTEQVIAHLRDRPWLLLLDNFEHLVEDGARLVRTLLERVPTLTCLVTSRQRLGLAGEQEFALLPLPTPRVSGGRYRGSGRSPDDTRYPPPDTLMQYASVQLFVDRARAARPSFALTEENVPAVATLCDRLEGLPLALELAASRVGVLTPAQILAQLEGRFTFLVSRQRDGPARHRSLRAAVETSYVLLSPELQRFFARLAVFRGGCTLEAVAAVCGDDGVQGVRRSGGQEGLRSGFDQPNTRTPEPLILECLEQLRECSLVQVEEEPGGGLRYRLLETLREYGWEQLAAAGELAAVRRRHLDWYLQLAEEADAAHYRRGQKGWLTRLEAELDNLRAALGWCQEAGEEPRGPAPAADRCAVESAAPPPSAASPPLGVPRVPDRESGRRRGVVTPAEALATARREQGAGEANPAGFGAEAGLRLANALWGLWMSRGHLAEGQQWLEGALARGPQLPPSARAVTLLRAAHLAHGRGDWERSQTLLLAARREYEQALTLARREGDRPAVARALLSLAEVTGDAGDLDTTWALGVEARQFFEELSDPAGRASTLACLAGIALNRGDRQGARPLLEERLALCRELRESELLVHALGAMRHLERDEGNYGRARAHYQESLLLRRELGSLFELAQSLEDLAALAGRERQAERAIRLLGAGEAFCETLGARPPVAIAAEYERTVAEGRATLGEAAFAAAWTEGRAMSLEEAVAFALEARDAPSDQSE